MTFPKSIGHFFIAGNSAVHDCTGLGAADGSAWCEGDVSPRLLLLLSPPVYRSPVFRSSYSMCNTARTGDFQKFLCQNCGQFFSVSSTLLGLACQKVTIMRSFSLDLYFSIQHTGKHIESLQALSKIVPSRELVLWYNNLRLSAGSI